MMMIKATYLRHNRGMSINAINSYEAGEKPASKWAKELGITTEQVRFLLVETGWHHTGKFANQTNFFRLPEDEDELTLLMELAGDDYIPFSKKKFWKKIEELKNNFK